MFRAVAFYVYTMPARRVPVVSALIVLLLFFVSSAFAQVPECENDWTPQTWMNTYDSYTGVGSGPLWYLPTGTGLCAYGASLLHNPPSATFTDCSVVGNAVATYTWTQDPGTSYERVHVITRVHQGCIAPEPEPPPPVMSDFQGPGVDNSVVQLAMFAGVLLLVLTVAFRG